MPTLVLDASVTISALIEEERSGEALEQLGRLRTDAGKRRHRRKQLIEDSRTHKASLYPGQGTAKGST